MTDLTAALREQGHGDLAKQLEAKDLAERLRRHGRDDLADALDAGTEPAVTPDGEKPEPPSLAERDGDAVVAALKDAGIWSDDAAA